MARTLLDLNTAPKVAVFRKLIELVRNDPTIKRVISRKGSFRAWEGVEEDSQEFTTDIAPAIRFTASNGPSGWLYPGTMKGPLYIGCEMLLKGTCSDDVHNLWYAVQRAIYPKIQATRFANQQALNAAGASTGLAMFSQPANVVDVNDNCQAATAQIAIDVVENIDT